MSVDSRATERIYAILFNCQLFGFPLASVIPVFAGVDSKPISITYRMGVVLLTLLCAWRAWKERWGFLRGAFAIAALVLACLLIGRIVWDATFVPIPLNLPWSDEWTYLAGVTLIPLLAFVAAPPYSAFEIMRRTGVWFGSITVVLVIIAAVYGLRNGHGFSRLSTDFLNPISLAQAAISCLIVINAQAIAGVRRRPRTVMRRLGRWFMTLICFLTVIASVSKGPILALFSVIALIVLFRGRMNRSALGLLTRGFALALALSMAIGLLLLVDEYTPIQVISRFTNAGSDSSTSTRLDLIEGAINQFGESPLFGSSFVEYSSKFYPHNIIVEAMMTNGVLGLGALVLLLFGCFYCVARILWNFPNERWIALLFIQYFVDSMFSGSLYFDAATWAIILVVLGCAQAQAASRQTEAYLGQAIQP